MQKSYLHYYFVPLVSFWFTIIYLFFCCVDLLIEKQNCMILMFFILVAMCVTAISSEVGPGHFYISIHLFTIPTNFYIFLIS